MTLDLRAEVEIWSFCACVMHLVIIIGTVWSLLIWLWGRYHVPKNVFLVLIYIATSLESTSQIFSQSFSASFQARNSAVLLVLVDFSPPTGLISRTLTLSWIIC